MDSAPRMEQEATAPVGTTVPWTAAPCQGSPARVVHHDRVHERSGRPPSARQGVPPRAPDACPDTEARRVTPRLAPAEAVKRVVRAGRHPHGGMGADAEHPAASALPWGWQADAYPSPAPGLLAGMGGLLTKEKEAAV
jgi:hypothetical protein